MGLPGTRGRAQGLKASAGHLASRRWRSGRGCLSPESSAAETWRSDHTEWSVPWRSCPHCPLSQPEHRRPRVWPGFCWSPAWACTGGWSLPLTALGNPQVPCRTGEASGHREPLLWGGGDSSINRGWQKAISGTEERRAGGLPSGQRKTQKLRSEGLHGWSRGRGTQAGPGRQGAGAHCFRVHSGAWGEVTGLAEGKQETNRGCTNGRRQVWTCYFGVMPLLGHSTTPELPAV